METNFNTKYEFRSAVLDLNLQLLVARYDSLDFYDTDFLKRIDIEHEYTQAVFKYGIEVIKEVRRINKCYYQRVKRLRDRIKSYLSLGHCVFVTLTFRDDVLVKTNNRSRRKYVTSQLKELSDYYLANIDYGVDDKYTKREHYHCVLVGDIRNEDFKDWQQHYGFTFTEDIRINKGNASKVLAKYVSKLVNHAIKDSTKRNTIIYSKVKL